MAILPSPMCCHPERRLCVVKDPSGSAPRTHITEPPLGPASRLKSLSASFAVVGLQPVLVRNPQWQIESENKKRPANQQGVHISVILGKDLFKPTTNPKRNKCSAQLAGQNPPRRLVLGLLIRWLAPRHSQELGIISICTKVGVFADPSRFTRTPL